MEKKIVSLSEAKEVLRKLYNYLGLHMADRGFYNREFDSMIKRGCTVNCALRESISNCTWDHPKVKFELNMKVFESQLAQALS